MRTETAELQNAVAAALGIELVRRHDATGAEAATWSYLDLETGDGMLALLEAMRSKGWFSGTRSFPERFAKGRGYVTAVDFHNEKGNFYAANADDLPEAVLLAAARALGVT